MSVVMLTSDLMFSSRAAAAAGALSLPFRVVGDASDLMKLSAGEIQDVRLVIVDLETAVADIQGIVGAVRNWRATPPAILAYGPHVHEERLAAAKNAGCDDVLSRGQFDRTMADLLRRYTT